MKTKRIEYYKWGRKVTSGGETHVISKRRLTRRQMHFIALVALCIMLGAILFFMLHGLSTPVDQLWALAVPVKLALVSVAHLAPLMYLALKSSVIFFGVTYTPNAYNVLTGKPVKTISPLGSATDPNGQWNGGCDYGPDTGDGKGGFATALADIITAGGGTLHLKGNTQTGPYTLNWALDANNNLISVPLVGSSDATKPVKITMIGSGITTRQYEINGTQPIQGTVLYATTTTGATSSPNTAAAAILGSPSGGGSTGQNNVTLFLDRIGFLQPSNPTLTCVNAQNLLGVEMGTVAFDVDETWSNTAWTVPTNVAACAFIGPSKGSTGTVAWHLECAGYYLSYWIPEHFNGFYILSIGNIVGIAPQSENNPGWIGHLEMEWNAHFLGSSVYPFSTLANVHGPYGSLTIDLCVIATPVSGFPITLGDTAYGNTAYGAVMPVTIVNLFYGNMSNTGGTYAQFKAAWGGTPNITVINDGNGTATFVGSVSANGITLGAASPPLYPPGAYPFSAHSPKYLLPTRQGQLYTNTALANITAGTSPIGVACTPDGKFVYVTNSGSANVSVIQVSTGTVVATVAVNTLPRGLCVTPDGRYVYVCNQGSGGAGTTVSVIATASNTVVATVTVGSGPYYCAVTPDGSKVLVVNNTSVTVSVISTATNTVSATITGIVSAPEFIAIDPKGVTAYVGSTTSSAMNAITVATSAVATVTTLSSVTGIDVTPDGNYVYVAHGNGTVGIIPTQTLTENATTITIGSNPQGLVVTPDGNYVYVVNSGGTTVSIISTATNAVVASPTISGGSYGIDVTPDGKYAYIASYSGGVVNAFNISTNHMFYQNLTAQTTTSTTAPGASMGSITFTAGYTGKVYLRLIVRANNNTLTDGVTIGLYNGATALDTETYTQEGLAGNSETFDLRYVLSVTAGTSYTIYGYMLAVTGGTVTAKLVELSAGPVA